MSKKIPAICWIDEHGKLSIVNEDKFKTALKVATPGRYFLTLEKAYNKRSLSQNNSIFGISYKILQECFIQSFGEYVTIEWVHNYCKNPENKIIPESYIERLKDEYLQKEKIAIPNKNTGEFISMPFEVTTTKMSTVEMMEYYSNLQDFALNYFETEIPGPDPDWKNKLT